MRIVVLFGGGDGGGLIITEHGVKPIPPFDPSILGNLKSAAAMVNGFAAARESSIRRKMAPLATNICNLAVEQVEQVVGPLDADRSLIFQDDDGGFVCGSTGKPPIPIPWPPRSLPSVGELIDSGVIEPDVVQLIQKAHQNKVAITAVFDDPRGQAKRLDVRLSEQSAQALHSLAPSGLKLIKDPVDKEIVSFFHKVIDDGHFMDTWISRPYEVAEQLGAKLSDAALERLTAGGVASGFIGQGYKADDGAIAAGIAWAGVCIVIGIVCGETNRPIDQIIRDRSNFAKL